MFKVLATKSFLDTQDLVQLYYGSYGIKGTQDYTHIQESFSLIVFTSDNFIVT
jgi:hypothetical protein